MNRLNFEFKATAPNVDELEEKLKTFNPIFKGIDHQIDTYFNVEKGRLKLREGNIENALIYYERENVGGAKQSDILLYQHEPNASLKQILTKVHGVKAIVDKSRKIYFVDNVKFHFDRVEGLGNFAEVEAIDADGTIGVEKLKEQCTYYQSFLNIEETQLLSESYSDMILRMER
jgi:predicted adenylyl cyclase CyaB